MTDKRPLMPYYVADTTGEPMSRVYLIPDGLAWRCTDGQLTGRTPSRVALPLWTTLVDLARDERTVELPVSTLATVLDVSVATLHRWRGLLVDARFLEYVGGVGRGAVSLWTPLGRPTRDEVEAIAVECGQPVSAYVW